MDIKLFNAIWMEFEKPLAHMSIYLFYLYYVLFISACILNIYDAYNGEHLCFISLIHSLHLRQQTNKIKTARCANKRLGFSA